MNNKVVLSQQYFGRTPQRIWHTWIRIGERDYLFTVEGYDGYTVWLAGVGKIAHHRTMQEVREGLNRIKEMGRME